MTVGKLLMLEGVLARSRSTDWCRYKLIDERQICLMRAKLFLIQSVRQKADSVFSDADLLAEQRV